MATDRGVDDDDDDTKMRNSPDAAQKPTQREKERRKKKKKYKKNQKNVGYDIEKRRAVLGRPSRGFLSFLLKGWTRRDWASISRKKRPGPRQSVRHAPSILFFFVFFFFLLGSSLMPITYRGWATRSTCQLSSTNEWENILSSLLFSSLLFLFFFLFFFDPGFLASSVQSSARDCLWWMS